MPALAPPRSTTGAAAASAATSSSGSPSEGASGLRLSRDLLWTPGKRIKALAALVGKELCWGREWNPVLVRNTWVFRLAHQSWGQVGCGRWGDAWRPLPILAPGDFARCRRSGSAMPTLHPGSPSPSSPGISQGNGSWIPGVFADPVQCLDPWPKLPDPSRPVSGGGRNNPQVRDGHARRRAQVQPRVKTSLTQRFRSDVPKVPME